MAYEWAREDYAKLPPIVQDARRLLEDWFRAIETGEVTRRMPDPRYPVKIDSLTADRMIDHIDREFEKELRAWANLEAAGGYTEGPGFARLAPPQRLALAQQLHALKLRHQQPTDANRAA
ncbi:MAG: hypothetical protein HY678_04960 [Chloroflexi bacterium]|nr:hypothetical protein [Chloroflexota bacterium]